MREDNGKVNAKYAEEKQRIDEKNKAAQHLLENRRAEETGLEQDTQEYYALEDAEKGNAKDVENAAWKPWHDQMDDVPVDSGPIQKALEPILEVSPEARHAIRQLVPDPSDAEPDSMYAKDRAAVMQSRGYNPDDYWKLSADRRRDIDAICASNGFTPDPIDLDPKAGTSIPLKIVQRAQSIIGRNIANGQYEGPLLGEMKRVQSVLREVVTTESANHGTTNLIDTARAATRTYQEAFRTRTSNAKDTGSNSREGADPQE